jgi:hypothetical protein
MSAPDLFDVLSPALESYAWVLGAIGGLVAYFGLCVGIGRFCRGTTPEPDDTQEFPPYEDEEEPAALPVDGGYLYRGRFYSSELVQQTLLSICDWWTQLTPSEQTALLGLAELAEMDREIDAAVFGATS